MKNWKHCAIAGIFAIVIVLIFIGCSNRLSGTWELYEGDFSKLYQSYGYPFTEITFSGKNYITNRRYEGTYSISGNQIELKDFDGDIDVLRFSRSENTITIDGAMFKRK
jgi:hypothetical protein